ncbi:MAG: metallophosphoesterase family protein [Bacteroidetes bacterium]|nr:metallophosphoesterase family protein [Bacteroidota bacterium]
MKNNLFFYVIAILLLGSGCKKEYAPVSLDKIRLVWNDSPETTMTIGWDQISGENPKVCYGTKDQGRKWNRYKLSQEPTREINHYNMNTKFCELSGLLPDKAYYFVIKDSEGVSERFWFKTAPDKPVPFTCILGGDTKSVEPSLSAGRFSNKIVAKLRPLFVVFCGDFTSDVGTNPEYWAQWLTDWFELTRASDGRLFPVVPVMGNHERGNMSVLNKIFNAPYQYESPENIYYSLSFGGNFFHMILLNSEIDEGCEQRQWLEKDLDKHKNFTFKLAAYHKPFRPHTMGKRENIYQYHQWAYLFYEYGLDISLDADSHMSKITYPLKPDSVNGFEGFVRDDISGTMYIGEGSWGAGYRVADDNKPWTLRSGSFNQLKWLQVFPGTENEDAHIDIRTVITSIRDSAKTSITHIEEISALSEDNVFTIPEGIDIYSTEPYGTVITYPFIDRKNSN